MAEFEDSDCIAFISSIPLLFSSSKTQALLMDRNVISSNDLEKMLQPFLNRLRQPARENILLVPFTVALFRDVRYWHQGIFQSGQVHGSKVKVPNAMIWHCVPGYFVLVRSVFNLFRQICRRRARGSVNPISLTLKPIGLISCLKEHVENPLEDYWAAYWHHRDLAPILDDFTEIFQNNWLVNPFVQVGFCWDAKTELIRWIRLHWREQTS